MPKVSVIIPTYNREKYIINAIESVLSQTCKGIEIIVVDDGSTDNTRHLLQWYVNQSLIHYIFQENKGPAGARNKGIKLARGRYLCFLDADDIYDSESVEKRLFVFERFPQLELVFTDYKKVFLENDAKRVYRENDLRESGFIDGIPIQCIERKDDDILLFNKNMFFELVVHDFIWTGTVMIRQKTFDKVGLFNEALPIAQDHELWLRIAEHCHIGLRLANTATYNFHPDNRIRNIPLLCDCMNKVGKKYLNSHFPLPREYKKDLRNVLASYSFRKGYYFFGGSEHNKAKNALWEAIKMRPTYIPYHVYLFLSCLPLSLVTILRVYRNVIIKKFKMTLG